MKITRIDALMIVLKLMPENARFNKNTTFKMNIFNIFIGKIGQTAIVAIPIYLALKRWVPFFVVVFIIAVCVTIMNKTCWDRLSNN